MILKPWLWLPSQLAHDLAPKILPLAARLSSKPLPYRPTTWRGLTFSNPIGIAGGVDKSGATLLSWQKLGAGFLEVGTVTPVGQEKNPGKVMDRDCKQEILWNKMGFPNAGALYTLTYLQSIKPQIHAPLFINIGKNRTTKNEDASQDYIRCLDQLHTVADAFVINISSPNTQGLRELLKPAALLDFLRPITSHRSRYCANTPLLLKLSPDMSQEEIQICIQVSAELDIDGWIITNTTLDRTQAPHFPQEGGVSGRVLAQRSREVLAQVMTVLGNHKKDRLVISVGGISGASDIKERLDMGADLVQVYSALVFQGPYFFKKTLKKLHQL